MTKKDMYRNYLIKINEQKLIKLTYVATICDIKYNTLISFIKYNHIDKRRDISEKRLEEIILKINEELEKSKFDFSIDKGINYEM